LVATAVQERLDQLYQGLAPIIGGEGQFYTRAEQLARDGGAALHDKAAEVIAPLLTAYYPSQILQAMTDGPILLAALVVIWLKPRRPGMICAAFMTIYGVLRIITEMYRQPDIGVPLTFGLLSRGQTLSVLMILLGLSCWWLVNRRKAPPIGGIFAP
jgi:prolipoprotein diacylglyceryltransferase